MKTKEELLAMSHEELAEYAYGCQTNASLYDYSRKQCDRDRKSVV